jgi:hypothetical protein
MTMSWNARTMCVAKQGSPSELTELNDHEMQ